jgi:hypothetical protein
VACPKLSVKRLLWNMGAEAVNWSGCDPTSAVPDYNLLRCTKRCDER